MHMHSVLRKSTPGIAFAFRLGFSTPWLACTKITAPPLIGTQRHCCFPFCRGSSRMYSKFLLDDEDSEKKSWRFPIDLMQNNSEEVVEQSNQELREGRKTSEQKHTQWSLCSYCQGEGRRRKRLSKKARFKRSQTETPLPTPTDICSDCQGSGLRSVGANEACGPVPLPTVASSPLHVAIVGGGLGGLALAAACQHRGIQVTVYERDASFHERRQGYGLTMQQAAPQLRALGIAELDENGITSTKHIVHEPDGSVVGEWGMRKWLGEQAASSQINNSTRRQKRQNVHIARQALRYELLLAATRATNDEKTSIVRWNHRFVDFQNMEDHVLVTLHAYNDDGTYKIVQQRAGLLVGADGIRSQVRQKLLGDSYPLRYLGCIVILGICPLGRVGTLRDPSFAHLLDKETVFQTADGTTRIYVMPYSHGEYMWQLSFPLPEIEAKALSSRGLAALQQEALDRCGMWHSPVGEIILATPIELMSGYPVYDREVLKGEDLQHVLGSHRHVTLVGDAAHPMSPFKGQGANQALLDALSLSRELFKELNRSSMANTGGTGRHPHRFKIGEALLQYESRMLDRSAKKVNASADAATFLHTDVAIKKGNVTRGAAAAAEACSQCIH